MFAGFQLVAALNDLAVTPGKYAGRDVFEMKLDSDVGLAYWQEGEHVVCTIGTQKPDYTVKFAEGKRPNLTGNDLFRATAGSTPYETIARGFIDAERILKYVRPLGPHGLPPGDAASDQPSARDPLSSETKLGHG